MFCTFDVEMYLPAYPVTAQVHYNIIRYKGEEPYTGRQVLSQPQTITGRGKKTDQYNKRKPKPYPQSQLYGRHCGRYAYMVAHRQAIGTLGRHGDYIRATLSGITVARQGTPATGRCPQHTNPYTRARDLCHYTFLGYYTAHRQNACFCRCNLPTSRGHL